MQIWWKPPGANGGWYCWESVPMKDSTIIWVVRRSSFRVTWDTEDEWLKIDNANGQVNSENVSRSWRRLYIPCVSFTGFEGGRLGLQWNSVHPLPEGAYSLTRRSSFLSLRLRSERLETVSTPSFIGRRQEHKEFRCRLPWNSNRSRRIRRQD